jgi:hypothetical protein
MTGIEHSRGEDSVLRPNDGSDVVWYTTEPNLVPVRETCGKSSV